MTISDFCASCEWLNREGAEINEAKYNGAAFGSWFIEVKHERKRRRAVWDGRDRWLIIQSANSEGEWKGIWIGREPGEHTVEQLVRRLLPH
jgi:hypothetical protein